MMKKLHILLPAVAVFSVVGFAILTALNSLRWPLGVDLVLMLYNGFLISDIGMAPYRDFFDMNGPGSMMLVTLLHQVTDGAPLLCKLVGLGSFVIIVISTCFALRMHGWMAGLLAAGCFALAFFPGKNFLLQREYLCVVLLAVSAGLLWGKGTGRYWGLLSFVLSGFLAGIAISIKPPTLLCWLPLLIGAVVVSEEERTASGVAIVGEIVKVLAWFVLGLSVSLAIVVGWLMHLDALSSFLDIARNYYPLYSQLSGGGTIPYLNNNTSALISRHILNTQKVFQEQPYIVLAFLGLWRAFSVSERKVNHQAAVLLFLVIVSFLYVGISGKYWDYHFIPLYYALALCCGLVVSKRRHSEEKLRLRYYVLVFVVIAAFLPFERLLDSYKGVLNKNANQMSMVNQEVTSYLRDHTKPEDKILPLDVTSGAIQVLYELRRPLYGKFIYDFHFYHHVNHPYIISMKKEFMAQFTETEPEVVLKYDSWQPNGRGCSEEFPELDLVLKERYSVILQKEDATILRRNADEKVDSSAPKTNEAVE